MNEKNYKKIIIVLSIVCAISIGFSIYYGTARNVESADTDKLTNTITAISERNEQLINELNSVKSDRDELERLNQRSIDGVGELRQISTEMATTSNQIGSSNQRLKLILNELATRISKVADKIGPVGTETSGE